jgi:hypothetical protein
VNASSDDYFIGRDKSVNGRKHLSKQGKTRSKNIAKVRPGPKPYASELRDEVSSFHKIPKTDMMDDILTDTHAYIESKRLTTQYCRTAIRRNVKS